MIILIPYALIGEIIALTLFILAFIEAENVFLDLEK
jgi:hypothetical protein